MNHTTQTKVMREIPPEWDRLMRVAAIIHYGEMKVIVQNGTPVRVDGGIKQIKLDTNQALEEGLKTIPLA